MMKYLSPLSPPLLLSFLFVVGNTFAVQGAKSAGATTSYYADLGEYGFMSLDISSEDDKMNYIIELTNIQDLFEGSMATYHLHSGFLGNDLDVGSSAGGDETETTASVAACGGDFTLGHYDPTLKCGGASSAPLCQEDSNEAETTIERSTTEDCCAMKPLEGYCTGNNLEETCEVGDLSGRFGKLTINEDDGTASTSVMDASCPNCNDDYLTQQQQSIIANFQTWGSIVFHDTIDGAPRVLCGNLILLEDDTENNNQNTAMMDDSSSSSKSLFSSKAITTLLAAVASLVAVFGIW